MYAGAFTGVIPTLFSVCVANTVHCIYVQWLDSYRDADIASPSGHQGQGGRAFFGSLYANLYVRFFSLYCVRCHFEDGDSYFC